MKALFFIELTLSSLVEGEVLGDQPFLFLTSENFRISKLEKSQQKIVATVRSSVAAENRNDSEFLFLQLSFYVFDVYSKIIKFEK